ncbi:DUF3142 domain-containing protein [Erwinia sp. SLM-02]|uniref:DUF3142 domain-containing protein n=1 Tax=Erwinia sp. SLM-02 TaxID=3020057 RepID=UPI00307FF48B
MGAAAQILLVIVLCGLTAFGTGADASASDGVAPHGCNHACSGIEAKDCIKASEHADTGNNPNTVAGQACTAAISGDRYRVRAADRRAFWLWSGVGSSAEMGGAEVVYLHQGEVNLYRGRPVFERVGLPVSRLSFPRIWLTVRLSTLDLPDEIVTRIVGLLARWSQSGNHVVGLQIDFDAATRRLGDYAQFLTTLREKLPAQFALGVTGLLDWASTGDIATLNKLPVDELVVQTYQGRHSVPNYARYLPALKKLQIPFRIGLVQHGEWDPRYERELSGSRWYRGAVVFMLRPVR